MADVENLPFHRKYRPNSLKYYVGNETLKTTVFKALASDKKPQTILLYGPSGCGKTTCARIIAKEYNCENRSESEGACGECTNCQAMDEYIGSGDVGTLFNVKEIDIGANSGKGDIESVLEEAEMQGFGDEWRIFIFDEIQRASDALQTRLLKITEEPPEHVLFIFCTTNPEKLLDTLKNRCQLQLKVTKPTVKELSSLLKSICEREGVACDAAGLELICNRAEFTIRTSLQMLKQVIDEQGNACYASASTVFEEVSTEQLVKFFKYLIEGRTLEYVVLIHEIKEKMELQVFLTELRNFVVKGVYLANTLMPEGITKGEMVSYKTLFEKLTPPEMSNLLKRLLNMDTYNLEMDLLLLGYQGVKEPVKEDKEVELKSSEDDLKEEVAVANLVLEEKRQQDYTQGVNNAEQYTQDAGLEDILARMGGSIVH